MAEERTLIALHSKMASLETSVRLMADYQKQTNENVVKVLDKHETRFESNENDIDDLKAGKNRLIGIGMASGGMGGIIGFIVNFLIKH